MKTYFTHLSCSQCKREFSPKSVQTVCPDCNKTLLAEYDLDRAKRELSRDEIARRPGNLWRYRELLPVFEESNVVTLGEGWTPLLAAPRLGAELRLQNLVVKEEGYNPTGSFKARGLALAVSKAKELGIREVAMPSAGNAGGALAAYASRAGISAHVFVPKDTPVVNIREVSVYGASVTLVDGVISDAAKAMNEARKGTSWFDMSTMKEPYRLEGKKTMGYELAEQFGWELPDVIFYPTGGGTGLIGMWKAFREMEALGWISGKRPRMVCVQSSGCAPVVRAFGLGKSEVQFWENAHTPASGLRVPKPFADTLILEALYESSGIAVAVPDAELVADIRLAARSEGLFLSPEGAATVTAARELSRSGFLKPSDSVLLFNTGSGYKYFELFPGA
jgi:threonine synthase